ncbi:MAG: hypothetical protein EOP11_04160 [Proteobacteria bacterium]|nr:MAG: hypothetical protein EOP11_04160 [Pseudomonadota bacterium]
MTLNLTKTFTKITLAIALVVAFQGCRVIDDTGVWRGTAVNRDDFRESYTCNLETDLTHTDSEIILHRITTDCGAYRGSWRPGTFEVHGTSIWKNGRAVGWARDDGSVTIDVTDPINTFDERYPYPASRVVLSWTLINGSLEYTEEAYFAGRVQRTHGWLRRDY